MTRPRPIVATALWTALALTACVRPRDGVARDVAAFCRLDRAPPDVAPQDDPFFAGLEPLAQAAGTMVRDAERAARAGADAQPFAMPGLEAEVRALLPRIGLATGALYVYGAGVEIAATPRRCADVLLDVEAERAALSAEEAFERRSTVGPAGTRRVVRLGMLDMGESPFRFDFRWTFVATSRARPDGAVLVRYDFVRSDEPQNVSAFSGVAILVPRPPGTLLCEVLAAGSRMNPPFFLKRKARRTVESILTRRILRLSERAAGR